MKCMNGNIWMYCPNYLCCINFLKMFVWLSWILCKMTLLYFKTILSNFCFKKKLKNLPPGGQGGSPKIVFSPQILFSFWLKTSCKFSKPYDDLFREKSKWSREKEEDKKGFFDVKLQPLLWSWKLKNIGWRIDGVGLRVKIGGCRIEREEWRTQV